MSRKTWLALLALMLAVSATLTAQGTARRVVPQLSGFKLIAPWRPANARTGLTRVVGTVIDFRQTPVIRAKVRLRDLNKDTILGETDTNDNGEYQFEAIEGGTYVVEMVLIDGTVVALSNAGVLARYETLNTLVQLPGRWDVAAQNVALPTNLSGFVGVSSATTMTSVTVAIATSTSVPPADPGEPVSP